MKNLSAVLLMFLLTGLVALQAQNIQLLQQKGNTHNYGMEVGGIHRSFLVHFPSTYNSENSQTYPVVFMLHGGGGTGKKYYNISGWKELGEQEGFISVFPTAQEVCIIDRETSRPDRDTYWLNSSKVEMLCEGEKPHDDVAFMRLIIEYLQAEFSVNSKRFYCTGFSNGMGFTLSRAIPELSDVFAAVGGAGSLLQEAIPTPQPLPCLMMIGERDPKLTRHNGGQAFPTTISGFKQNEFLVNIIGQMANVLQLSFEFEAVEKKKHTSFFFTKTLDGGSQQLQFSVLKGLAHVYPRGIAEHNNIMAAEVFWDFFKQYEKE